MKDKYLLRDFVIGILFVLFSIVLLTIIIPTQIEDVEGLGQVSARFFPNVISSILGVLGAIIAVFNYRGLSQLISNINDGENDLMQFLKDFWQQYKFVIFFLLMGLMYFYIIEILGYIVSTILFLVSALWIFGERKIYLILGLSVPITIAVFYVFVNLLSVRLPSLL